MNSTISDVYGQNTVSLDKAQTKLVSQKKKLNSQDDFMNTLTSVIGSSLNDVKSQNSNEMSDASLRKSTDNSKNINININVRISNSAKAGKDLNFSSNSSANNGGNASNLKNNALDSTVSNLKSKNEVTAVGNAKTANNPSVANVSSANSNPIKDTINDTTNDIVNEVKDAIKDALNVTDEDIENAMNTLGITIQDLLNPSKLASLFMMLTGNTDSDMASILTDSGFNDLFNKLNDLSSEILSLGDENGVALTTDFTFDNLKDIDSETIGKALSDIINGKPDSSNIEEIVVTITKDGTADSSNNASDDTANALNSVNTDATGDAANTAENTIATTTETGDNTASNDSTDSETKNENSKNFSNQNTFTLDSSVLKNDTVSSINTFSNLSQSIVENLTNAIDNLSYKSGVDTQDIISQIVSKARTTLSDTVKSMEMELNPQSLGKMIMKVSEQAGTVTAHITVQNENVKEALTNQMALLKTNLESNGTKVQEVTITADPHQFERNLEEGQELPQNFAENQNSGNSTYEENENGSGRNRRGIGSINLSDMTDTDLSGLNNDEILAAHIMQDNGNRMNIRA